MADALTLVIRGGTVVDGTGAAPFEADIGIAGNRIVARLAASPAGATKKSTRAACSSRPASSTPTPTTMRR